MNLDDRSIAVQVIERSLERGERVHELKWLFPKDSLTINDAVVREGGPSPVQLKYLESGVLQLIIVAGL